MTVKTSNVIRDSYFNKCTAALNYVCLAEELRFGRKGTGLNAIMRGRVA